MSRWPIIDVLRYIFKTMIIIQVAVCTHDNKCYLSDSMKRAYKVIEHDKTVCVCILIINFVRSRFHLWCMDGISNVLSSIKGNCVLS